MTEQSSDMAENTEVAKPAFALLSPTAISIGGGVAAGIASSFIPMNAIEGFVSAYGIAELLPAAAPPLGNTARLALSTGIGTLTAGALLALLPRGDTNDMGFETSVAKDADAAPLQQGTAPASPDDAPASGFSNSKLGGWLRALRFGKATAAPDDIIDFADLQRMRMRSEDRHPDAPMRAPILASSDFGAFADAPLRAAPSVSVTPQVDAAQLDDQTVSLTLSDHMAVPAVESPIVQPGLPPRFGSPAGRPALDEMPAAEDTPTAESPGESTSLPMMATEVGSIDIIAPASPDTIAASRLTDEPAPAVSSTLPVEAEPGDDLATLSITALLERLENGLQRRMRLGSHTGVQHTEKPQTDIKAAQLAEVTTGFPSAPPPKLEEAAEPDETDTARPFRFRVDRPLSDAAESSSRYGSPTIRDSWNGEVEYQPPAVEDYFQSAMSDRARPLPVIEQADADGAQPFTAAPTADDEMDAALRDALATLRQLSDRQRNV